MAVAEVLTTEHVARLVRRCLEDGRQVEIERLGTFRPAENGGIEFRSNRAPTVFLAYAAEDARPVEALYDALQDAGFHPWMDRRELLAGQNWPRAIEGAIRSADFFIACLSGRSVRKPGTFQSELRYALDCARRAPLDDVFFVPVRLEECAVPAHIAQELQYVDLFPDFGAGAERLVTALRKELRRRNWR